MDSLEYLIRTKLEAAYSDSWHAHSIEWLLNLWFVDYPDDRDSLWDRAYWEAFTAGGGIADVLAATEVVLLDDYTATPWVNQGTQGAAGNLAVTNGTASSGAIDLGATGYLSSGGNTSPYGVPADADVTLVVAGTFDFATRTFAVGTRSVTGATNVAGISMTFKNTGGITGYIGNGTIVMSTANANVAPYANIPAVITMRYYRSTGRLKIRANGTQLVDSDVAAIGSGALEASSTCQFGGISSPAQGLLRGFAWDRRLLSDDEIAAIETYYGV